MYCSRFLAFFDCDKVTAFFLLLQDPVKMHFSGILSICSLDGGLGDKSSLENAGFCDRVSILRNFCGKSFFMLFLLFSLLMKKI